jgi:hypothetical protein
MFGRFSRVDIFIILFLISVFYFFIYTKEGIEYMDPLKIFFAGFSFCGIILFFYGFVDAYKQSKLTNKELRDLTKKASK